jgi:hypothetical protein
LIGINSSTAIMRYAELDGLFRARATPPFSRDFLEIGRLIPKVAETEQISKSPKFSFEFKSESS